MAYISVLHALHQGYNKFRQDLLGFPRRSPSPKPIKSSKQSPPLYKDHLPKQEAKRSSDIVADPVIVSSFSYTSGSLPPRNSPDILDISRLFLADDNDDDVDADDENDDETPRWTKAHSGQRHRRRRGRKRRFLKRRGVAASENGDGRLEKSVTNLRVPSPIEEAAVAEDASVSADATDDSEEIRLTSTQTVNDDDDNDNNLDDEIDLQERIAEKEEKEFKNLELYLTEELTVEGSVGYEGIENTDDTCDYKVGADISDNKNGFESNYQDLYDFRDDDENQGRDISGDDRVNDIRENNYKDEFECKGLSQEEDSKNDSKKHEQVPSVHEDYGLIEGRESEDDVSENEYGVAQEADGNVKQHSQNNLEEHYEDANNLIHGIDLKNEGNEEEKRENQRKKYFDETDERHNTDEFIDNLVLKNYDEAIDIEGSEPRSFHSLINDRDKDWNEDDEVTGQYLKNVVSSSKEGICDNGINDNCEIADNAFCENPGVDADTKDNFKEDDKICGLNQISASKKSRIFPVVTPVGEIVYSSPTDSPHFKSDSLHFESDSLHFASDSLHFEPDLSRFETDLLHRKSVYERKLLNPRFDPDDDDSFFSGLQRRRRWNDFREENSFPEVKHEITDFQVAENLYDELGYDAETAYKARTNERKLVASLGPPKLTVHCRKRRLQVWGLRRVFEPKLEELAAYFDSYGRTTHLAVFYENRHSKTIRAAKNSTARKTDRRQSRSEVVLPVPVRAECVDIEAVAGEEFAAELLTQRRLSLFKRSSLKATTTTTTTRTTTKKYSDGVCGSSSSSFSISDTYAKFSTRNSEENDLLRLSEWDLQRNEACVDEGKPSMSSYIPLIEIRPDSLIFHGKKPRQISKVFLQK